MVWVLLILGLGSNAGAYDAKDPNVQDCFKKMSSVGIPVPPPAEGPSRVAVKGSRLQISGPITSETAEQVAKLDLKKIVYVDLESYGGDVSAGIKISELIHAAGLATVVPNKAICGSICTLIFQSGKSRTVMPKGILAYHSSKCLVPFLPDGNVAKDFIARNCSEQGTRRIQDLLSKYQLAKSLAQFVHEVPFESVKCLNREEAVQKHADSMGRGESLIPDEVSRPSQMYQIQFKKNGANPLDDNSATVKTIK